jgi:hypothetical protein
VFGFPGADIVVAFAFAAMGFLIARQYPRNPVGWIMLVVAVLSMTLGDAQLYAVLVYRAGHASLPLGPMAAVLGSTLWGPALSLLPIGVLLFTDGASPRRGGRSSYGYASPATPLSLAPTPCLR